MPDADRPTTYSRVIREEEALTLVVTQQARETAPVIRATLRHYPPGRAHVVQWEVPDGRCAVIDVVDQRRTEVIIPSDIPLASLRPGIAEMAAGRDVWVVVAVDRMAAARRAFRSLNVQLQSWWIDEQIHFGRPEKA